MEIKVGDKVRVSKDAPEMYFFGCNHDNSVYEVILVDRDNAEITQIKNGSFAIPTKYLTKVNVEAKEPKFKKGDRVKYVGKEHPEFWGEIFTVDGEIFYNDYHKNMQIDSIRCEKYNVCNVPLSELKPYTEPTEQTEAEKNDTDNLVNELDKIVDGYRKAFADIADSFDWQRYEADLAKEIAIKLSKPNEYKPGYVAEYSVSVAKAVVENLKKK